MAEERQRMNKESNDLQKKNEHLEKLCRGMQAQGRGRVADVAQIEGGVNGNGNGNTNGDVTPRQQHAPAPVQDEGLESTGSEYDDDYEDQDGGEEEDDDDEDEDEYEEEEDSLAESGEPFDVASLPPKKPTLDMDGNPTKFVLDPNDKTRSAATQWNDWYDSTRNHADFLLQQQQFRQEREREKLEREKLERQNGGQQQQQNPDHDLDRHAMPPPPTPAPPRAQQTQTQTQSQVVAAKQKNKENARPAVAQVNGVNGGKH